jgi:hypothetical protein
MTTTALRPLGIGEVLDTGIKIYRANAATLIKLVLVIVAPVTALGEIVTASADSNDPGTTFDTVTGETVTGDNFWTILAAALVVALLGLVASVLATGACFKAVADAYLGRASDWRHSLGFAARRLGSIVWITFLSGFLALLAALACILPGVLVGLAAAVDVAAPQSLGSYVVDFFAQTLASALTTPFTAAVTVVVYFDLRVRKEAFDLELLAEQLGVEPPVGSAAPTVELAPPPAPEASDQPPFWPPPPGWKPGGGDE